jgi:acetyl/propionyl-CoA carboxylase alpha subunit
MYRKILIANRGEIACRIARTARRMGMQAATVHSSADAGALHVREIGESVLIGAGPARQSYLDIDAVLGAAQRVGAEAIHPGFGFLSENAEFARRCAEAGIAFIGPTPEVLALFGDKAAARRLARKLDIPVAAGLDEPADDVQALLAAVAGLPLPYVLKAVAGGGGKGMRVVRDGADARSAIEAAIREARSAFGDGRLIAERYLQQARHIEVQILGDGAGNVVHLFDRECTLQRRYQKVVEEAPVSSASQEMREQLWAHAVGLGRTVNYLGLGTVEFAVTAEGAFFLEVNPRLQVEHPVTEAVTGLDLVELQIQTLFTRTLPFGQAGVPRPQGFATQARLYAEDPAHGFVPSTGRIAVFEMAGGVRTDAGVAAGCEVSPHYDPMIAKVIAHAGTRQQALLQLRCALEQTTVLGVASNRAFLLALLADPQVQRNEVTTEFIDPWLAARGTSGEQPGHVAALMALWLCGQRAPTDPTTAGAWHDAALTGWRARRAAAAAPTPVLEAISSARRWRIGFAAGGSPGTSRIQVDEALFQVAAPDANPAGWQTVTVDGCTLRLRAHCTARQVSALVGQEQLMLDVRPLPGASAGAAASAHGVVRSPMMGLVIGVDVQPGESVNAGDRLATMESMKMEMAINAPIAGKVAWMGCAVQARVERHQDLFRIEPAS